MARKKRKRPAQGNNFNKAKFSVAATASPNDLKELSSGKGSARDKAEAGMPDKRRKGRRRRKKR